MKEFDYKKAKECAPVCTRDGRPARIVCWDALGDQVPILALVTEKSPIGELFELPYWYDEKGKRYDDYERDLMMAGIKHEGWVLVDKGHCIAHIYDTKEEAEEDAEREIIAYSAIAHIEWEE